MSTIDPSVVHTQLAQGLRERAADLGDEDRFQQQVLETIAVLPQRSWPAGFGRWTRLVLVAAAVLGLVAASLAAGGLLRQPTAPLGSLIAVAADARAGAGFDAPLDPMLVEFGPGPSDIFVVGQDVAPRRMFPSTGVERACPAYSPDGLRFMHFETSDRGDAKYVISRLDGSGTPAITEAVVTPTTSPASEPSCAQWSPDGRSIAYAAPDAIGQMELHVQELGGGEVILNPTPDTTTVGGFAWSPVARTIAYVDAGLFIVPIDGSPARLLMPSTDEATIEWVTWAPDGSTLDVGVDLFDIVRHEDGSSTGSQTGSEIRRIRLDGTIEAIPDGLSGMSPSPTVWSPDGQTIAYETDAGIILTDREGRTKGALPGGGSPRPLAWSPDGRHVLAVVPAEGDDGSTLALLATDLATVTHLTPTTLAFAYVARDSVSWRPEP